MSRTEELKATMWKMMNRIKELPDEIARTQGEANHKDQIAFLNDQLKQKMLGFELEAGLEVDDNGKKINTNKDLRAAKAKELADADHEYQAISTEMAELEGKRLRASILIDQLRNELSGHRVNLNALTEMLRTENIEAAASKKVVEVEVRHVTG